MFGMGPAPVADIAAAIGFGVGVQDLLVEAGSVDSQPVASPDNRRGIDSEDDCLIAALAHKGPDTVIAIMEIDPLKAVISVVKLVVSGLVRIEPIEVLGQGAQSVVHWALREMPIQTLVMVPLLPLTKFDALEDKLLAGMRPH